MEDIQASGVEVAKKPKNEGAIVSFVVNQWKKLQENRASQIDLAMNLQKWATMNQEPMKIYNTKQEVIDGYKDNKFTTVVEVTTAQVGNQSWTNIGQMFDVRSTETMKLPEDLMPEDINTPEFQQMQAEFLKQGEEKARLQKVAIEQSLIKMGADLQIEKCFKTGDLFYGEKISWVGWKQKSLVQKLYGNRENRVDYDNADIQYVDPIAFVFDTVKYVKDDDENFKKIIKIHKRFETIESILSRKYTNQEGKQVNLYKLSKEQVAELRRSGEETTNTTEPQSDDLKMQEVKVGDAYATYFVHGDFKIEGVEYKNYIAEVFADKYLIRFEPNPIYICPFVIKMDVQDPETKRGVARLKTIYDSCVMRQMYINLKQQKDFLNGNPPTMMTVKMKNEFLKNNRKFEWKPGMIIGIDELSQDYNSIKPFTFDNKGDIDNISFITTEIGDNGAVNANAMGNIVSGNVKATDLNLAKQGQDIRLQQTMDSMYSFTLKNIEAVANILALFKSGIEVFKVKNKNVEELIAISDIIRQGQYEYRYEDRNALMNRKEKVDKAIEIVEKMSNAPDIHFDYIECFKTAMESIEYDNPEKFLKSEVTAETVINEFQQLRPEEQQQIVQMVMGQAQNEQKQAQDQQVQDWNRQQRYDRMLAEQQGVV